MVDGRITRGTTATNRLRRTDRWIAGSAAFLTETAPLVVDLGFGHRPWTTTELFTRLRRLRPAVQVLGLEIDPDRVRAALPYGGPGLSFAQGGFDIPLRNPGPVSVIRAMNVLRQYDEGEVLPAWRLLSGRLRPGGLLVEGTSNETGRVASWVSLGRNGPESFTVSLRLSGLERPSVAAERLPKVLIHRNIPGEPIHQLLTDLDSAWRHAAPAGTFGPVQRWLATLDRLPEFGWRPEGPRARRRLGELTLPWTAVAPVGFDWGG